MSTNKWDDYIVNGGEMPTLDLPQVPPPVTDDVKYIYTCWECGKLNDYWYRLCAECDAKLDSEERA